MWVNLAKKRNITPHSIQSIDYDLRLCLRMTQHEAKILLYSAASPVFVMIYERVLTISGIFCLTLLLVVCFFMLQPIEIETKILFALPFSTSTVSQLTTQKDTVLR
jgi:hypothetical protein